MQIDFFDSFCNSGKFEVLHNLFDESVPQPKNTLIFKSWYNARICGSTMSAKR